MIINKYLYSFKDNIYKYKYIFILSLNAISNKGANRVEWHITKFACSRPRLKSPQMLFALKKPQKFLPTLEVWRTKVLYVWVQGIHLWPLIMNELGFGDKRKCAVLGLMSGVLVS